jgi:predicted MFS family arabinose efflux permease
LRTSKRATREKGQVRAGLAYARSKSTLWIPLVVMAIVGTLTYNFGVVLPLLAERTFHGGEATFTALYSALSVGSLVGALAAARRTTVTLRTVCVTCSLFGVTMLAFAIAPTLLWAFPAVLVVGWASTFFMTAGSAIVQLDTSADMQGRIGALQSITLVGSTPIGSPIVGWVCERFGARAGLVLGAGAAVVAAAWGTAAARRHPPPSATSSPSSSSASLPAAA